MSDQAKAVFIGAVAGVVPICIVILNTPDSEVMQKIGTNEFYGQIVKMVLFVMLGGLIVYLHKERDLLKAFQLALAGPAIIAGYITASDLAKSNHDLDTMSSYNNKTEQVQQSMNRNSVLSDFSIFSYQVIPEAIASGSSTTNYLRKASGLKRFWYGFSGGIDDPWFVIVGSYKKKKAAERKVKDVKRLGYDAKVYDRFGKNKFYGVMIGSYLPLNLALKLKDKAIKDGLPKDTYLWKWR